MVLKDWKRINTHVWESIRPLMWQWLSPAQTVLLSQVMQAQQGREFLIGVGRHFCRLVGEIYILISERDMIVLKYGARLSLKVSLPFSSGKWVMGFAGVYPSLSSSHVTQGKLVHYPMHQCLPRWQKYALWGVLQQTGPSPAVFFQLTDWQEDMGQVWSDFFHTWLCGRLWSNGPFRRWSNKWDRKNHGKQISKFCLISYRLHLLGILIICLV